MNVVVQVDVDKDLLLQNTSRAKPLLCDYVKQRETPLKIEILRGSISTPDICLKNTDAVIGIEIIEHLYPDVLEDIPYNIFGYIKPKIAIFTTPNAEFNVLFQLEQPNGFRHWDHKFEWTRSQFKNWCLNICARFPNYLVSIHGVSKGPPEKKELGPVSQLAVFIRKDVLDITDEDDDINVDNESNKDDDERGVNEYELICNVDFPYIPDERTYNEKILDETKYQIHRLSRIDRFRNSEKDIYEIPLQDVFNFIVPMINSVDELKKILLSNNYEIIDDNIIMKIEENDDNGIDDLDDCFKYGGNESDENDSYKEAKEELMLSDDSIEIWD